MTGTDFQAIASILAGDLAVSTTEAERQRVRAITLSLADYCLSTNPRFNRAQFYLAAGLTRRGELR